MPISKTVSGLVTEIPCDQNVGAPSPEGWSFWKNVGNAYIMDDTIVKREGTASQKVYGENSAPQYPGEAWAEKGVTSMSAGNRAHLLHKSTDDKHTWSMKFGAKEMVVGLSFFYGALVWKIGLS